MRRNNILQYDMIKKILNFIINKKNWLRYYHHTKLTWSAHNLRVCMWNLQGYPWSSGSSATYYTMVLCDDEATRWLCVWYTYKYMYIMILWCWDVMRTRWWLHSTTGLYERPMIEVAYGETLIHSTEAVWEILAREEWLGCRHDASLIFDIPGSTTVWA